MQAQKSPRNAKARATPPALAPEVEVDAETHQQVLAAAARPLDQVLIPRKALTMVEAGKVAGVTKAVIRQEIRRGRLPAYRVGYRRIRISIEALTAYLKQRQAEGV